MTSMGRHGGTASTVHGDRQAAQAVDDGLEHPSTASFVLWPWAELARRNGIPIEHFCELAGLEPSALRDSEARFPQAVANRVATLAFEHFGSEAAMAAALTVEAGAFNLLELVARTASTVADGMEQGCRFFSLVHDGGQMLLEPAANGGTLARWSPPQGYEVHHGYVELAFAVALRGIRRETGRETIGPLEVWFSHALPSARAQHDRLFGCTVQFGMPQDRMIFSRKFTALSLKRKNPDAHSAAIEIATELLDE